VFVFILRRQSKTFISFSFSRDWTSMREDLINSALSFLSDPKVQDAPLTKKVSFLESKGMTSEEIEEALARANGKSTGSAQTATATAGTMAHQPIMVQKPPPVPVRPSYDWKDVFIGAVLAGGLGYGAWTLAKVRQKKKKKERNDIIIVYSYHSNSGSMPPGSKYQVRKK
jgi:hypothetical protein